MQNEQLKKLTPVSQIIFKALMESNHTDGEKVIEFLKETEDLWQHKKAAQDYKHAGAYFLARAYHKMEKEHIIGIDGHVLNVNALGEKGRLNGFLCRPRGYAPVNYQQSKTIMALASLPTIVREGQSR